MGDWLAGWMADAARRDTDRQNQGRRATTITRTDTTRAEHEAARREMTRTANMIFKTAMGIVTIAFQHPVDFLQPLSRLPQWTRWQQPTVTQASLPIEHHNL